MSEGSAIALWDLLGPSYRRFYHAKSHVSLACGKLAGMAVVAEPGRRLEDLPPIDPRTAAFGDVGARIVHVDRGRLDPVLYDEVRAHPCCEFIESRIQAVDFDPDLDRVTAVRLDDGQSRPIGMVFDATGYRGVVAAAAKLRHRHLSRLQRVVWMHRSRDEEMIDQPWWHHGTNLIRLQRQYDGVDGIAWMIPLGREVSVGISVDAHTHGPEVVSEVMLAEAVVRAYDRRGMPISRVFPRAGAARHLTHRYFVRGRAYGANWLLAGATYGQVWFPTSTGVATSALAAYLAPAFLERPSEVGAQYAAQFQSLRPFHDLIGRLVENNPPVHMDQMYRFWGAWIRGVLERLPEYLRIYGEHPKVRTSAIRVLTRVIRGHGLAWLGAGAFLTIRVQRVISPKDWETVFPTYHARRRFWWGNFAGGWVNYLGSRLAQVWRGDTGAGRLGPASNETAGHQ
ncbi:MAG: tryptophan 7-halogenase [Deltaproteobacteria bacterium]|nr:tryptophan 7-halogenase [Deltaproteobacteria bacterium]